MHTCHEQSLLEEFAAEGALMVCVHVSQQEQPLDAERAVRCTWTWRKTHLPCLRCFDEHLPDPATQCTLLGFSMCCKYEFGSEP